jgi:hypothetical protein
LDLEPISWVADETGSVSVIFHPETLLYQMSQFDMALSRQVPHGRFALTSIDFSLSFRVSEEAVHSLINLGFYADCGGT